MDALLPMIGQRIETMRRQTMRNHPQSVQRQYTDLGALKTCEIVIISSEIQ